MKTRSFYFRVLERIAAAPARLALLLTLVIPGAGCTPFFGPISDFPQFSEGELEIITAEGAVRLEVEIAETSRQLRTGLKGRTELPSDRGMIFLFDEEQGADTGFWMYRTLVPLSIAFLDDDGVILGIQDMEPCASRFDFRCRRYLAGVPYQAALEVNLGFFRQYGIQPGDRVRLRRTGNGMP